MKERLIFSGKKENKVALLSSVGLFVIAFMAKSRKGYEFSKKTKDEVFRRERHKFPEDEEVEVDHIVSVRQCKEGGIPKEVASSIINAQLLTKADNRSKSDADAPEEKVSKLKSLMPKLFK